MNTPFSVSISIPATQAKSEKPRRKRRRPKPTVAPEPEDEPEEPVNDYARYAKIRNERKHAEENAEFEAHKETMLRRVNGLPFIAWEVLRDAFRVAKGLPPLDPTPTTSSFVASDSLCASITSSLDNPHNATTSQSKNRTLDQIVYQNDTPEQSAKSFNPSAECCSSPHTTSAILHQPSRSPNKRKFAEPSNPEDTQGCAKKIKASTGIEEAEDQTTQHPALNHPAVPSVPYTPPLSNGDTPSPVTSSAPSTPQDVVPALPSYEQMPSLEPNNDSADELERFDWDIFKKVTSSDPLSNGETMKYIDEHTASM